MARSSKNKSEPILLAQPKNPNLCFVLFPAVHLTASSAAVSLQSLLIQLQKQPGTRRVEAISYDPQTRRMDVQLGPDSQPI